MDLALRRTLAVLCYLRSRSDIVNETDKPAASERLMGMFWRMSGATW
jgi:hypothetical protein